MDILKSDVEILCEQGELVNKEIKQIEIEEYGTGVRIIIITTDKKIFCREYYEDVDMCTNYSDLDEKEAYDIYKYDSDDVMKEILNKNDLVNLEVVEQINKEVQARKLKKRKEEEAREYEYYLKLKEKYEK
ncbi:hypothetical protein P3U41_05900 [Mammaliicoccus sciuri]|uniref:hypothetical protein n=1 Tax=Mammaliicoccus sciuri TaxID=1296 RepID=UPI002B25CDBD|nr:hypothetical protein [Mammaliicoccus sciuri]WQL34303.1 hypothetical protein P3U41_05900 [Mammaliicoccus sciuri]WQL61242.1 hypothetical protein P3T96_05900 [Mammaliicoccus sciuri]